MKKFFILCFFCFVAGLFCVGQTKTIEQLKKQIHSSANAQQKLQAYLLLSEQRQTLNTETLHQYAFEARQLSRQIGTSVQKASADYLLAYYFVRNGQLDSALFLCNQNLHQLRTQKQEQTRTWMQFAALQAHVFVKSNKYKEAIATFYTTLTKAEHTNDTLMQMVAKNGIGWVNMEMNQSKEALRWFYRALETSENPLLHQKNANIYSNMAAVYTAASQFDSADKYIRRAIDLSAADENLFFLSNSLNILADNYIRQNQPALAEEPLQRAARIREQIGDPFYIVSDLSQLALFYAELGQPQKGIAASNRGISMARKYGLVSKLPFLQLALAKNYKAAGDYRQYGETLEKVLSLKDSVYQQNTEQELAEIRVRYNRQKQENLIIQQELALNKKNMVIYGVLIVVFFGVIISGILFTNYKRKQRLVVTQMKEAEKRKVEQAVMAAKEAERKRISADLHDNLGAYATAISANTDDLLTDEGFANPAMLQNIKGNADNILSSLNESIWVLNKSEIHLTNLCDRFKSYVAKIRDSYPDILININETITENKLLSPEAALNILRIMQEAFHNAIRHSGGDCVLVEITGGPVIEVCISDNGSGMRCTKNGTGHGLSNMQKRAKLAGCQLSIQSEEGKGTTVKLAA